MPEETEEQIVATNDHTVRNIALAVARCSATTFALRITALLAPTPNPLATGTTLRENGLVEREPGRKDRGGVRGRANPGP